MKVMIRIGLDVHNNFIGFRGGALAVLPHPALSRWERENGIQSWPQ